MPFASLNSNISKAVTACGYTKATPIQAQSIPVILQGKDLVACAQTGTGKTAAFVLPALHRLSLQPPSKKTRILILTPTRELASQITKAANLYGKFLRFNIISLVGGMPYHHQIKDLERGADIIVATPGRLLDHVEAKRVNLSGVEMLVLDEADRMLDMGFIDDVQYIANLTPANRQTLLFSATVDKELSTVVRKLLKNPTRIDLSHEKISAPKIKQELYKATSVSHKARLLKHCLKQDNIFKAIIFSGTKVNADRLAKQLRDEGFAAAALHGDLRQNVRNRTLDELRRGKIQFLVATDVAARGIDVSDITHVINYDLPKFCEDYVHRIGRTGRAGKSGTAISFVLPSDIRHLQRIERYLGQKLQLIHNTDVPATAAGDVGGGEEGGRAGRGGKAGGWGKKSASASYDRAERHDYAKKDAPWKKKFSSKKKFSGDSTSGEGREKYSDSNRFSESRNERNDRPKKSFDRRDANGERYGKYSDNKRSSEARDERSDRPKKSFGRKDAGGGERYGKQSDNKRFSEVRRERGDRPKKSFGQHDKSRSRNTFKNPSNRHETSQRKKHEER